MRSIETEFSKRARKANKIDNQGMTPIMHKAAKGKDEDIAELIKDGADVNFAKMPAGLFSTCKYKVKSTALHIAIENCRPETVDLLLQHDADTSLLDSEGYTPLDLAVKHLNTKIESSELKEKMYVSIPLVLGTEKSLRDKYSKYNRIIEHLVRNNAPKNLFQSHEDAAEKLKETRGMGKKFVSVFGKK